MKACFVEDEAQRAVTGREAVRISCT